MVTLKIISNPYKKEVKYQKLAGDASGWIDIDYINNRNSGLLSNDFVNGFFPFKVRQIIDCIIKEYMIDGEQIKIYFEGSTDEYKELEEVCSEECYEGNILTCRSDVKLANARDILPEVKNLFQEISPLIMKSVNQEKIAHDLDRFKDASSDVVPVCILGNYSTGKSTFINALIGSEILPSGIEPVTAKIYKISRSKYTDRASVKCLYQDRELSVFFTDKDQQLLLDDHDTPLYKLLKDAMDEEEGNSLTERINRVLAVINDFENDTEESMISDLIEVEIPFVNGVLAKSQHPFVIFDTPGSNSASNAKHLAVLKQAMANMTNGLPIFLSTPEALDSTDNENLYKIIREMDELDSRFTMIVVNKADGPGLKRKENSDKEERRILDQAVPRNLYSGGLFYVSSILGLGSKNKGDFLDDFYAETFEDQVYKYNNPEEKRYKQLYSFNIMPTQIKKRAFKLAAEQTDLVYANSGLFSVETEVETFAGKYAAYNKCSQSQMFLNRVIHITEEEIEDKKVQNEENRSIIKDKLESDKKQLIDNMEATAEEKRDSFSSDYPEYMQEYVASADEIFSVKDLRDKEEEFTGVQEDEMDYEGRQENIKKSFESIGGNLLSNFNKAKKNISFEAMKDIASGIKSDVTATFDNVKEERNTRHQVDEAVANKLLDYVAGKYEKRLAEISALLIQKSQDYWSGKTEELRNLLAGIVAGSEVLTDERRRELERVIITYQPVEFDNQKEEIFKKVKFERYFKLGDQIVWQSDHLNIEKLAKTYNVNMKENIDRQYDHIEESHRESAYNWIRNLLDEINTNIVEYSPELSRQAKQIQNITKTIEELMENQAKLREYTNKLGQMMDWKEIAD